MEKRVDYYVKLRGLPFDVEKREVIEFLSSIKDIKDEDVAFRFRNNGGFSGLAFIKLQSEEDEKEALGYHRKYLDKRYVEVFTSSQEEFISADHTKKDFK